MPICGRQSCPGSLQPYSGLRPALRQTHSMLAAATRPSDHSTFRRRRDLPNAPAKACSASSRNRHRHFQCRCWLQRDNPRNLRVRHRNRRSTQGISQVPPSGKVRAARQFSAFQEPNGAYGFGNHPFRQRSGLYQVEPVPIAAAKVSEAINYISRVGAISSTTMGRIQL